MIRRKTTSLVPQGDETLGTKVLPWSKTFATESHVYGDLTVDGQINVSQIGTIVELGPLADGGVVLREVSNSPQLVSSTDGEPGNNAVPTQAAVVSFVEDKVSKIGETLETVENDLTVDGKLTITGEVDASNSVVQLGQVSTETITSTQGGHVPGVTNEPNGSLLVRDDSSMLGYGWRADITDPIGLTDDVIIGTNEQNKLTVHAETEFTSDVYVGKEGVSADLRVYGDLIFPNEGQLLGSGDLATTLVSGVVKLNKDLSFYASNSEDDRVPTGKTVFDALQNVQVQDATTSQKGIVQLSEDYTTSVETGDDGLAATVSAVKGAHAVAFSALNEAQGRENPLTFSGALERASDDVSVRSASTTQTGVVQLSNSFSSTSESTAATSNGLKTVYDEAYGLAGTAKNIAENKQDPFVVISPLNFTNNDTELTVFSATPSARGVVVTSSDPSDIGGNVTTKVVGGITTGVAATPALVNEAYTLAQTALTAANGSGLTPVSPLVFDGNNQELSILDGSTAQKGVVQLSDAVDSDSTTTGASSNAVKLVQDDLNVEKGKIAALQTGKQDGITFPNESPLGLVGTELSVTNASTGTRGVVQLTNTIDNREDLAMTPKGVNDLRDVVVQRVPLAGTTDISGDLMTSGGHRQIGSNDFRSFSLATNNTKRVTVTANGLVGIGEIQPSHPLHVMGVIFTSETVLESSDKNTKTDISPIENAMEKLSGIQGVTFSPLSNPSRRATGVLAQDVEKVLPEAVHETKTGEKSVAYGRLVGLLIEGMKELRDRVDLLESRLAGCESAA